MTTNTILLLLLSLVIASGLSFYQYYYKAKNKSKITLFLALLRFISIFAILVLLINPIFSRKTFEILKTPLPIVVDNSSSIIDLKSNQTAEEIYNKLIKNNELQEKYDIQTYAFDSEFLMTSNFTFKGKQTNLDQVAKNLKSIHKIRLFPTVIITDGNQTQGNDYVYSFDSNNKVYPLVLGDTTTYLDLKVNELNVNKYAFHKNKFPVEVFLQYSGTKSVNANFSISQGNTVLSTKTISFSASKKSAIVNVLLPADKIGLQIFKASITSKEPEKNTYNNTKNFTVEVIDQKMNVAIISAVNHPDIGALKRAIESNAQRKVTIVNPKSIKSLDDYNILILYQPTAEFKTVFEANKIVGLNTFIITGTNTDFGFLNQQQDHFVFKMSNQNEDYLAAFNAQFNLFSIDDIGFEQFPPLKNAFGTITTSGTVSTLLSSKIRNIDMNTPLLAYTENQGKRGAFLFGENSWKWRLQSHVVNQSFEKYDTFIDKTIQYLASSASKKSLVVHHESYYNTGDAIAITAQYFNKNYEFDEKARLSISVFNKNNKQTKSYDLLKTNTTYSVNLDGLLPGKYSLALKELNSKSVYNGYFEILDFDIEKQFVNPDVAKLSQLANQTQGKVYYPNQTEQLIKSLLENENFKPVQKTIVKKTPIIDWMWLLIIIATSLTTEWFIRKYNGML